MADAAMRDARRVLAAETGAGLFARTMSNLFTTSEPLAATAVSVASDLRLRSRDATPWRHGLVMAAVIADDRDRVLAHLLRLSDDDRHLRFLQLLPDAALRAHVAALDFARSTRIGMWLGDGTLVGMLEAFPDDAGDPVCVELAFSTDPDWRRLGVARALYEAAAATAWRSGARQLSLHCTARNRPMRALLRAIGAETEIDAGDVHAIRNAPTPIGPRVNGDDRRRRGHLAARVAR